MQGMGGQLLCVDETQERVLALLTSSSLSNVIKFSPEIRVWCGVKQFSFSEQEYVSCDNGEKSTVCDYLSGVGCQVLVDDMCDENQDCFSGRCTMMGAFEDKPLLNVCKNKLPNDSECEENSDCVSGRCDNYLGGAFWYCQAQKEEYGVCNTDADCESNYCNKIGVDIASYQPGFCDEKKQNGQVCTQGRECESGRCIGVCSNLKEKNGQYCAFSNECESGRCDSEYSGYVATGRTCQDKLNAGSDCDEHSDCHSGSCTMKYGGLSGYLPLGKQCD